MAYRYIEADRIRNRILAKRKGPRGKTRWHGATPCEPCADRCAAYQAQIKLDALLTADMAGDERWAWAEQHPYEGFTWGCEAEGCWRGLILAPEKRDRAAEEAEDIDYALRIAFMDSPKRFTPSEATQKLVASMEQPSQMRGPKIRD